MKLILCTLFALVVTPAAVSAQDFKAGKDAYLAGDYDMVLREWRPLAEQGVPEAQLRLARMYRKGQGVPLDYGESARWYRMVAEKNVDRLGGTAEYHLGVFYQFGKAVPQDHDEAVLWYRKGAEHGNGFAKIALEELSLPKENIRQRQAYAARQAQRSLTSIRTAAEQGHAFSQYKLGVFYNYGRDVPQNYAKAVKWYRLAAEQGIASAQNSLGTLYENGEGVPQNYAEAVKWYRLAAEQEAAIAQNNLGNIYANGRGVTQDYVTAHMWYNIAAANGAYKATENRDFVADKMTNADISKAQSRARICIDSDYQACD